MPNCDFDKVALVLASWPSLVSPICPQPGWLTGCSISDRKGTDLCQSAHSAVSQEPTGQRKCQFIPLVYPVQKQTSIHVPDGPLRASQKQGFVMVTTQSLCKDLRYTAGYGDRKHVQWLSTLDPTRHHLCGPVSLHRSPCFRLGSR